MARIFSGIIFYQLACGSAFISTTVFQLDLVRHFVNFKSICLLLAMLILVKFQAWGNFDGNFFVIVCVVVLSIMCIFPYCFYASQLSLDLEEIAIRAFHSKWYKHPVELQKYMTQIIAYAQIRRSVYGFGIFRCSLEVFMKVFTK